MAVVVAVAVAVAVVVVVAVAVAVINCQWPGRLAEGIGCCAVVALLADDWCRRNCSGTE